MKFITVLLACALSGCGNTYTKLDFPNRPPELQSCAFFELTHHFDSVVVATCPAAAVTTTNNNDDVNAVIRQ